MDSSSGIGGTGSSGSGRTTPEDTSSKGNTKNNNKKTSNKSSPGKGVILSSVNTVVSAGKKNKKAKNKKVSPSKTTNVGVNVVESSKVNGRKIVSAPRIVVKQKPRSRSLVRYNSCSCPCCGDYLDEGSDYEGIVEFGYFSESEGDLSTSCFEEDSDLDEETVVGRTRMNRLLLQNAEAKAMLEKNKYYNRILTTQKIVREQQLIVLQRTNALNASFVRNMEAIIRLGYCPLGLQQRTDNISRGLLDIHKMIQKWDERLEVLIPVPKTKGGQSICVLPSLLQVFKDKYSLDIGGMTDEEFESALKYSLESLPELLPDEATLRAALQGMDLKVVESEWDSFECKAESHLRVLEVQFIELCMEYGVRVRLPPVPGYEWAHAGHLRRSGTEADLSDEDQEHEQVTVRECVVRTGASGSDTKNIM